MYVCVCVCTWDLHSCGLYIIGVLNYIGIDRSLGGKGGGMVVMVVMKMNTNRRVCVCVNAL